MSPQTHIITEKAIEFPTSGCGKKKKKTELTCRACIPGKSVLCLVTSEKNLVSSTVKLWPFSVILYLLA